MPNLKQNDDGSLGIDGATADKGEFILINVQYTTASPLTIIGAAVPRNVIVHKIYGFPVTAASNAVTATIYKAASGTALGSGTAIHSGSFNLQGTAATLQELTLSTTAGVTTVPEDYQLGVVISGALGAAGSGTITIACSPA